jgi:hypothetical protein
MSESSTPDHASQARSEGKLIVFPDTPEVMTLRAENERLKSENLSLLLCIAGFEERVLHVKGLEAQNRLLMQLSEALGDYNRYCASLHLGYPASDNQAFDHYIMNGGKKHFDETHPPRG